MSKIYMLLYAVIFFVGTSVSQVTVSGAAGTANGTYTSFSNAGGAFAALNATGAYTAGDAISIAITADVLNEAGTNALIGIPGTAWASLTIAPTGGARVISGTPTAGSAMITFTGADNVTINGGGNLTFSNTLVSGTSGTITFRLVADATNNTFNGVNFLNSATGTAGSNTGSLSISTGSVTGNDNNSFQGCKFGPAGTNLPTQLVISNGSTTNATIANSNVTFNNCEFFDFFNPAIASSAIYASTGNTQWNITNNKVYQTATRTMTTAVAVIGFFFTNATFGDQLTITGNTIGYNNAAGTGTMTYASGAVAGSFNGIQFGLLPTATTTSNINNNTVNNF